MYSAQRHCIRSVTEQTDRCVSHVLNAYVCLTCVINKVH